MGSLAWAACMTRGARPAMVEGGRVLRRGRRDLSSERQK